MGDAGPERNAEIAERLFVAPSTIKTHLGHVFAKLGVGTRAELAALAARRPQGSAGRRPQADTTQIPNQTT